MIRKDLLVAVLLTFCLTVTLFRIISTTGQVPGYDIWLDFNDDGKIDMRDIGVVARAFGANGQPINKTFVLLETQKAVGILNATIEARVPQREVISISAAAFVPHLSYNNLPDDAQNNGRYLTNRNDTWPAIFYSQVQLPHGVNVTRVYIFWRDIGVWSVEGWLVKAEANHTAIGYWDMVHLESPEKPGPGWGSTNTNIIEYSIIDNYYQYFLRVRLPPSPADPTLEYYFYYAIIEYEYPA